MLILFPVYVFGMDCKVDGISASPQDMNCYVHAKKLVELLNLNCIDGNYQLHWKNKVYPVDIAYHEEVEAGANPLVFRSRSMSLTTTSLSLYSKANLSIDDKQYDGLCFIKALPK
jgi:hypothetical protein